MESMREKLARLKSGGASAPIAEGMREKLARLKAEKQGNAMPIDQNAPQVPLQAVDTPPTEQPSRGYAGGQYDNAPPETGYGVNAPQTAAPDSEAGMGSIRALLQGGTLGWSDEIGAAVAAAAAKVAGDEKEYAQIYDEMVAITRDQSKDWNEANPKTKMALELVGGIATGGASANVLGKVISPLSKTKKAQALLGGSTAEGALAGAGASEGELGSDEFNQDTAVGAGLGMTFPVLAKTLGKLGGAFSKRRVDTPLEQADGSFLPYNLAAEEGEGAQRFMQNTVSQSLGGKNLLDQNTAVRKVLTGAIDEAKEAKKLSDIEVPSALNKTLRGETYTRSLPTDADDATRAVIADPSKQGYETIQALEKSWKDNGFNMVTKRDYDVTPDAITTDIGRVLDSVEDSEYRGSIIATVKSNLEQGFDPETGLINGDRLMAARNSLSSMGRALKKSDNAADVYRGTAMVKAANAMDTRIESMLSPDVAKAFGKEKQAYGDWRTTLGASTNAGQKNQGFPTAENVLTSSRRNNPKLFATGNARFQTEAQEVQQKITTSKNNAIAEIEGAQGAFDAVKGKLSNANPTGAQRAIATGIMGVPAAVFGGAKSLLLGSGLAKVLGSNTGQKLLAGQADTQQSIAAALRKYSDDPVMRQQLEAAGLGLSNTAALESSGVNAEEF